MGMLGKVVGGRQAARRAATYGEYIPAGNLDAPRGAVRGRAGVATDRAMDFYRNNPVLVHALAATAGAILLTRLRRRSY